MVPIEVTPFQCKSEAADPEDSNGSAITVKALRLKLSIAKVTPLPVKNPRSALAHIETTPLGAICGDGSALSAGIVADAVSSSFAADSSSPDDDDAAPSDDDDDDSDSDSEGSPLHFLSHGSIFSNQYLSLGYLFQCCSLHKSLNVKLPFFSSCHA